MSDEIEEFIRRAAERRKQQGSGKPPRPAPPQQAPRPRAPLTPPPQVVEAEIVSAELLEEVSSSVAAHINTSDFDNRLSHLGETTAMADDRMEARLHQKFDHQLGRLAKSGPQETTPTSPTPPVSATAPSTTRELHPSQIAAALRSPVAIRQAIILGEILKPVELDW